MIKDGGKALKASSSKVTSEWAPKGTGKDLRDIQPKAQKEDPKVKGNKIGSTSRRHSSSRERPGHKDQPREPAKETGSNT